MAAGGVLGGDEGAALGAVGGGDGEAGASGAGVGGAHLIAIVVSHADAILSGATGGLSARGTLAEALAASCEWHPAFSLYRSQTCWSPG